jgi:NAD(P)-dependent dehydrogenase (short-subunit alcohol dehydrogenase family)
MDALNILITGASGGIGKYLIDDLSDFGHNLALHYNSNSEAINENIKNASSKNIKLNSYKADLLSEIEVKNLIENVIKDFGKIDVLINNAGISINSMSWKMKLDDWNKVIGVNLTAGFLCSKYAVPSMKENNFGRIIFISSVVSQIGVAGTAAYAASKSGLFGLCKTLSKELIRNNITVNTISLGYFECGMLYQIPEEIRLQILETIPSKKFGNPSEISNCVKYLISENSSYITGQTINLNGGLF